MQRTATATTAKKLKFHNTLDNNSNNKNHCTSNNSNNSNMQQQEAQHQRQKSATPSRTTSLNFCVWAFKCQLITIFMNRRNSWQHGMAWQPVSDALLLLLLRSCCMQQATCNNNIWEPDCDCLYDCDLQKAWQTNLKTHKIVQFINNYYISFINQSNVASSSLINLWFFCISSSGINSCISISRNLSRLIDRPQHLSSQ